MPHITVAGELLFYALVEGDPRVGPDLILVHGAGGNHTQWPAELRRLPRANVYALDLPGHGHSTGKARTRIDDYAGTVHLFAQTLGLKRASVAGHSMGGAIAQMLALSRPAWLEGIILIACGPRLEVDPTILDQLRPQDGSATDFSAAIKTICQQAYGPAATQQMIRRGCQQLLGQDQAVIYGDYIACGTFDTSAHLSAISVPVLIISGTADQITPSAHARQLRDQIPGAQLTEIKDAGHMVMVEKPGETADAVLRFLDRL
jgi:pimeloyl-ACP methyl ester carboxylesterase